MKAILLGRIFGQSASRQSREQAYLNQSVSMTDLERRQNEIARGMFRAG